MLLEGIIYWDSLKMKSIDLTRNNCRWCSILFKTCYCPGLWKYDEILCFQWCETRPLLFQHCRMLPEAWLYVCNNIIEADWFHGPCQNWDALLRFFFLLLCSDWSHSIHDSYRWCFCTKLNIFGQMYYQYP